MKYTRKFLINGKEPSSFNKGICDKDLVFTDVETGKEFNSFYDMARTLGGCDDTASSGSTGTESYHRYAPFSIYVYTDGVMNFCETHECWWLHDLINSYYPWCSNVIIPPNKDKITYLENNMGKDDFLVISLIKTSENSAMFTIEMEDYKEDNPECYNKTIACQNVPFTDIDVDQVEWFSESGVVLEVMEH